MLLLPEFLSELDDLLSSNTIVSYIACLEDPHR